MNLKNIIMKPIYLILAFQLILTGLFAQPGKYAGTKKSLVGKKFTDSRNITGLQGWQFHEGGVVNPLTDPEMITVNVFKKGSTVIVLYSIKEDTLSDEYRIADVLEIKGVTKGWEIRSSFCRRNGTEDTYITVWGRQTQNEFMKLIKKAWRFNPDKRRIEAIPVKGIDCENIGC